MDNAQSAFSYFVNQGLSPAQAAGIVGNLQGESGQGLNPTAISKGDGSDGSDSIGIAQWNGARAKALQDYAASKGVPWTDLPTQLEFLHSELRGPESAAYKGLQAAQTPQDAAQAMLGYERPKDWNVPGSHPERAKYASAVYSAYGGGARPQDEVAASPAAPSAPLAPPAAPPVFAGSVPAPLPSIPQFDVASTAPPIFAPPRRPIDLSGLQAALAARAPIFPRLQG